MSINVSFIDIKLPSKNLMSKSCENTYMTWRADRPYNELPLLPPDLDQVESRAVLKACIPDRNMSAEEACAASPGGNSPSAAKRLRM